MNKQEIINELRAAAKAAFSHEDGTVNKYQLIKASGLDKKQITRILEDDNYNPTIESVIMIAGAVGRGLTIKY